MCGPIAIAIPVDRKSNLSILSGTLQYNAGRIFTYAILGLIVGSLGISINTLGILQWISIIAGVGILIFAWRKFFQRLTPVLSISLGIETFVSSNIGKIVRSNSPFKLLFLGSLNGLLPCGMVFAALLNAVLTGDMLYSALAMIAFGVGTLPSMIAVTFMANKFNMQTRKKLSKAVPYLLTVVGLLVILRGMNLDIPYISPKISSVEATSDGSDDKTTQVEMSCCADKEDCEE
jgi:sulfite exporter TauE/SafE